MSYEDRRCAPRYPVTIGCKVRTPGDVRFAPAISNDVSRSGAFVTIRGGRSLVAGDTLDVALGLSSGVLSARDAVPATVVRAEAAIEGEQRLAIAFSSSVGLIDQLEGASAA